MDLFEINNNFSSQVDDMLESSNSEQTLIWQMKVRRTINTFALIPKDKETLKVYHKELKKAWGCNGSLKINEIFGRVYDKSGIIDKSSGRNIKELVFHLTKECVHCNDETLKYNGNLIHFLKSKGINEDNIEVKEV